MAKSAQQTAKKPAGGKPTATGKQVATQKSGALAEQMPDFMKGDRGKGAQALGMGDIEVPRIKLIQAVSPERESHDATEGAFWHTVTEQELGDELKIIPVFVSKAYILWRPRPPLDQGGMLARAMDGVHWAPSSGEFTVKVRKGQKEGVVWRLANTVAQSGLDRWGTFDPDDSTSPPAATQMINVACVLPDFLDLSPVVVTLQRSSLKVGKKLAGKLKMSQIPTFGRLFSMSSVADNGPGGAFKNYAFEGIGMLEDKDLYEHCKGMYEGFSRMGLNIKDLDDLQNETTGDDSDDDDKDGKPGY